MGVLVVWFGFFGLVCSDVWEAGRPRHSQLTAAFLGGGEAGNLVEVFSHCYVLVAMLP